MWKTKIYVATETDGLDVTNLIMVMGVDTSIIKNDDDFERAIILASTEYCLTNEGKETFKHNW